jgi:hypothetical protein
MQELQDFGTCGELELAIVCWLLIKFEKDCMVEFSKKYTRILLL